jgi:hypothetical protein
VADWEAGKARAGEKLHWGAEEIIAFLDRNPTITYQLVEDIYDEVKTQQEKDQGKVHIGRRPRRTAASMDEVWDTILPQQYSMDPFPEALAKLLNGQSQRAFSRKVPCHQTTLSRLMAGKLEPDLTMLENIARAARVTPAFFVEWRAMYVGGLVTRVLMERPNMSVTALQRVNEES